MTRHAWLTAVPWLALMAVGAAALGLRYGLIEPSDMAQRCGDASSPWWCAWRQTLVLGFLYNVYGIAALLAAAFAMFSRRIVIVWLAAALGLFALELYCFQSGALALLIGCLRLLRVQARRPPAAQHRPRQGDVQPQP
jgi:hypothetical protein